MKVIGAVRYSLITWLKTPVVFVLAVLMLGVGIGASVAAYGFLNASLLQPLSVRNPQEIMRIAATTPSYPSRNIGAGIYYDLVDFSPALAESFFDRFHWDTNFQEGDDAVLVTACEVSGNYFQSLEVGAIRGRVLEPDDDRQGAAPVVAISERFWRDQFNAREDLVGSLVLLNGRPATLVGVIPRSFRGLYRETTVDVWFPHEQTFVDWQRRSTGFLSSRVFLRLREGSDAARIQGELDGFVAATFMDRPDYRLLLKPEREIQWEGRRDFATQNLFILGVLLTILLIACANVSNILLAKVISRKSELALRRALGASRRSIFGILMMDALTVSVIGGMLGILFSVLFVRGFGLIGMEMNLDEAMNLRVLVFFLLLVGFGGFLCGLVPAIQSVRVNINEVLKESSRTSTRFRTGGILIITQVAFSLVLLVASGLFIRSLQQAQAIDPGVRVENLLTFGLNLGNLGGYEVEDRIGFKRRLIEDLDSHPDIVSSGISDYRVLRGAGLAVMPFSEFEFLPEPEQRRVGMVFASPGILEAIGVPLLSGRSIEYEDLILTPKRRGVVMINETLADRFWPGVDPIGQEFRPWGPLEDPWRFRVIGVFRDFRDHVRRPVRPLYMLSETRDDFVVSVHTRIDAGAMKPRILAFMREFEPSLPVRELRTAKENYALAIQPIRAGFTILTIIGVLGLIIAVIGVYAAFGNWIRRSRSEIGLRMALGADIGMVVRLYVVRGALIVLGGLLLGIVLAAIAMPHVSNLFYEVSPRDPVTLIVVPCILFAAALVSCYLSARHAARVEPMDALRAE